MRYQEDLERELGGKAARREKRGKQKMKVSGRNILKIKESIAKKRGD